MGIFQRLLRCVLLLTFLLLALLPQISLAQQQAQSQPQPEWPRKFTGTGVAFSVYQPQLDTWRDNQLSAYSAVEVVTEEGKTTTYGVVFFSARTEIDKLNREVTLEDLRITKVSFPTVAGGGKDYSAALQKLIPTEPTISLDHLVADLNLTKAEVEANSVPLNNDPPKIIFSTRPAVLVLIDGQPVLRPVPEEGRLQRVINSRSLILFDGKTSLYYLQVMNGYMQARALAGPWTISREPPTEADKVQEQLFNSHVVNLIEAGKKLSDGAPPGADKILSRLHI